MNYEKKYKDALERMKSWARGEHPECFSEAQKTAEFIFPELKEKESEDERIRKELCKAIWTYIPYEKAQEYITWLEKQGEQNTLNADKIIEWLKNNGWCTVGGPKVEMAQINKFKKDFGL